LFTYDKWLFIRGHQQGNNPAIKETDMKTTAHIYEYLDGSDDPRDIESGRGPKWRLLETRTASLWLLRAYVRAMENRYSEEYKLQIVSGGAA
jgi:hypothetical protein